MPNPDRPTPVPKQASAPSLKTPDGLVGQSPDPKTIPVSKNVMQHADGAMPSIANSSTPQTYQDFSDLQKDLEAGLNPDGQVIAGSEAEKLFLNEFYVGAEVVNQRVNYRNWSGTVGEMMVRCPAAGDIWEAAQESGIHGFIEQVGFMKLQSRGKFDVTVSAETVEKGTVLFEQKKNEQSPSQEQPLFQSPTL